MTFKRSKNLVSMLLIFAMTVALLPVGLFSGFSLEIQGEITESEMEPAVVSEIPGYRGEFEKHYEMSDGTVKAVMYGEAIHYKNEDGWQEVDNTVTLNSSGTKYTAGSGTFMAEFGSANRIYLGSSYLEWSAGSVDDGQRYELAVVPSSGNMTMAAGTGTPNASSPTVATTVSKVAEVNAYGVLTAGFAEKRTIVRNVVSHNKISQSVAVMNLDSFDSYEVTYKLNGLIPTLTEYGAIVFSDSEGNMQYTVSPVTAYDLNGTFLPVDVSMNIVGNELFVAYTVNVEDADDGITLNSVVSTSNHRVGIVDTTKIGGENIDDYSNSVISVGYGEYNPGGAVLHCYYTGYIKFKSLPNIPFENELNHIQSIKIKVTGISTSDIDTYVPMVYKTDAWRSSSETGVSQPLIPLWDSVGMNSSTPISAISCDNSLTKKYSFDITDNIGYYHPEEFYFAFAYPQNVVTEENGGTSSNVTNSVSTFHSSESTDVNSRPYLEVIYQDVKDYKYMVKNTIMGGKYLDMNGNEPSLTLSNEYKRENLWVFERDAYEDTYYIKTSESVYLNDAYSNVNGLNSSSSFDFDIKYLASKSDESGVEIVEATNGVVPSAAKWNIDIDSNGAFSIYQKFTGSSGNVTKKYLSQQATGVLALSTLDNNNKWTFERCDIISGKVYTIKSKINDSFMSVEYGLDDNCSDLIMESIANRSLYKHQMFRIDYLPNQSAYKIRTMVNMNGWFRCIDILTINGEIIDGCTTQIYDDSDGTSLTTDKCQLFDIVPVDNAVNTSQIVVSDSYSYSNILYLSSTSSIVEIDSNNNNNCKEWVFEEYTNNNEEYYKSLGILFPVANDAPWKVTSSWAIRDITSTVPGASDLHRGVDFSFPKRKDENGCSYTVDKILCAPFDAEIVVANWDDQLGYYVTLESEEHNVCGTNIKIRIRLQHMKDMANYTSGSVDKGTPIGIVGDTGVGSGEHLHYSVIIDGGTGTSDYLDTLDPLVFYDKELFYYKNDNRFDYLTK